MKKMLLALFFSIMLASAAAYGEEYKALVIGVSVYDDEARGNLATAFNDAEEIAEILQGRYRFNVRRLYEKRRFKSEEIWKELDTLKNESKENESVLIYYAGHGEDGKWIASDGKYIEFKELIDKINQMKSRNVLLISDSCFAGTLFNVSGSISNASSNKGHYRWVITSGNNYVTAQTGISAENKSVIQQGLAKNNGVFAYNLIKVLLDKPENKEYSFKHTEIFDQLEKYMRNSGQKPEHDKIVGNSGGEFRFSATKQPLPIPNSDKPPISIDEINGKKMEMNFIYMKPGTFMMGTPPSKPEDTPVEKDEELHWVRLTGFYMQTTEVTQKQWNNIITGDTPSFHKNCDNCPVENVSWDKVQCFIQKLNNADIEETKEYEFRLPTEAQWEYACRAGTQTPFSLGYLIKAKDANYNWKFSYFGYEKDEKSSSNTVEVDHFPPNQWGLYGMHGNVWEWCKDAYDEEACHNLRFKNPECEPKNDNNKRVIRGGAWTTDAKSCRCAHRAWAYQDQESIGIGFRLVLVPKENAENTDKCK